jgi:hypothetical protein
VRRAPHTQGGSLEDAGQEGGCCHSAFARLGRGKQLKQSILKHLHLSVGLNLKDVTRAALSRHLRDGHDLACPHMNFVALSVIAIRPVPAMRETSPERGVLLEPQLVVDIIARQGRTPDGVITPLSRHGDPSHLPQKKAALYDFSCPRRSRGTIRWVLDLIDGG